MRSEAKIPEASFSTPREPLSGRFSQSRKVIEQLCRPLTDEDCMLSATADTSPPKWHLAHTTWFFEHFILNPHAERFPPFDSEFNYLFNSYYRAQGKFLPKSERPLLSRPSMNRVYEYRKNVSEQVLELIESANDETFKKIAPLIELGIHHEQQHQELLLMDIKQNFFSHPLKPAYLAPGTLTAAGISTASGIPNSSGIPTTSGIPTPSAHLTARISNETTLSPKENFEKIKPAKLLSFLGGVVEIGNDSDSFHYDNEGGRHRVWLEPFHLFSRLVTQCEYLEFIEAGGYEDPAHWLSDGWDHLQKHQWKAPLYWVKENNHYQVMTMQGMKPLNLDAPVSHISYYEAQAYAAFKKARLPTETEWEYAASLDPRDGHFMEDGNFNAENPNVFHGELWEWTQSAYLPYPGYHAFDQGLFEYNSKFMCNQFVLRGGSVVTPRSHYRTTYRNFFYPHLRWQFSGFRLAKDGT